MDWHKLQHTLFEMDPVDPSEELNRLREAAQQPESLEVENTTNFVNESFDLPEGSLALDKDYSVSDFAALAGVKIDENNQKTGSAGQLKGTDKLKTLPAGSKKNATRNKLVGDSADNDSRMKALEERVQVLESVITKLTNGQKPVTRTKQDNKMESLKDDLLKRLNSAKK